MSNQPIKIGQLLTGPLFNEPVRVETVRSNGPDTWVLGLVGLQSEKFRSVTLAAKDLASLAIQETTCSYDGNGQLLRLGYDITSLDLNSGELRFIEVKGIGAVTGTVLLTPNERRVAEDRRDCYWLYVVTDCNSTPKTPSKILPAFHGTK